MRPRASFLNPFGRSASPISPITHVSTGVTAFSTTRHNHLSDLAERLGRVLVGLCFAVGVLAISVVPPTTASAVPVAPPFQLYLPVPWNGVVNAGGPHPQNGIAAPASAIRGSVDFGVAADGAMSVYAAATGTISFTGPGNCWAMIDHGSNWKTGYMHLINPVTSLAGTVVTAGTRIGDAGFPGVDTCYSGTFRHVHFGIYHNGAEVAIDGLSIGGYTVHQSGAMYCGYWTRDSDNATVIPQRCDAGPSLNNNILQPVPVLPAQPTNPAVTSVSTSSAALVWTDASNNETGFVSQYRIGTGAWVAGPSASANVTSMTVNGLSPSTTYTFQVGAQNSVGTKWSTYFNGTTAAVPVLPAQPTNPAVTSVSTSSAALVWTDASNNETGFVSQYRIGTGAWVAGPSASANVTSMTVNGLSPSTTYTFQVGAQNSVGTKWSTYFNGTTAAVPPPPPPPPPPSYHAGRQVTIDSHATGGVSGHTGPADSYATGPTRPANSALWIVCYVNGQSITGPYNTTTIWDLSDDGYYYTDAWVYTGTNGPAVPACAPKTVAIDSHATGGVSGHRGPDNSYAAGPTHQVNSAITIFCYVDGQSITGPYNTTTIWDLSNDGYYYTDAWIYTGTNGAAVPHC